MGMRLDALPIDIKARIDGNGYLLDEPVIARVGFQEYRNKDGSIRVEFRPRSEVFKPESLAAFAGIPVTLGHKWVTTDQAKSLVVGAISSPAREDGIAVRAGISIFEQNAIAKAMSKEFAQLSVGYRQDLIERKGWGNDDGEYVWQDEQPECPEGWKPFDALQTNIRPNHVALCRKGRAGIAKLNLDECDIIADEQNRPEAKIVKITLDEVEFEVEEPVAQHIARLEAELDSAKQALEGVPAQIEEAINAAKAEEAARAELVSKAEKFGVKCDALENDEIKRQVIAKAFPGKDTENMDSAHLDAYFDVADGMAAQREEVKTIDSTDVAQKSRKHPPLKGRK